MNSTLSYADIEIGTELPERTFRVRLADLIRYCGAASDFVGVHWNQRIATAVGLPNVIAHGSLTVARSLQTITDWAGPGAVEEYEARYASPLVIPDDEIGTEARVRASVVDKLDDGRIVVAFEVRSGGQDILKGLRATVRLPGSAAGE